MDDGRRTTDASDRHTPDLTSTCDATPEATSTSDATPRTRRRGFLAACGSAALAGLAGCDGLVPGSDDGAVTFSSFRGSGPLVEQRDAPGGTSIDDLPDLSGTLTMYLGGGEGGLYLDLVDLFEGIYPDFTVDPTLQPSSDLANRILEETDASETPADVFVSVDAGTLGAVAEADVTTTLPDEALEGVPESLRDGDDRWVGVAGRARAIPYNTNELSADDVPASVQDFPDTAALQDAMAWGPSYSAFQSFVTAMRVIRGDEETRAWLEAMLDTGITEFPNEFRVSNAVADGEIAAGFANHYYALRVQNDRSDAPIDLAFTEGDAGALVNASGATVLSDTAQQDLAENFVRHLLSSEAQEFFATRTFSYPTVADVSPVGGLPSIDELNPPDLDLTELSDIAGTLDMLREVGVL